MVIKINFLFRFVFLVNQGIETVFWKYVYLNILKKFLKLLYILNGTFCKSTPAFRWSLIARPDWIFHPCQMISQSACLSMLALTVTISRTQNRSSVLLIRIVPLFSVSILARSTYLHLFQTPPNGRRTWIILKSRDSSRTNSPKDCRARFTSDTKVSDVNCDNRRNGIVIRNSSSGDCTDERTRSLYSYIQLCPLILR